MLAKLGLQTGNIAPDLILILARDHAEAQIPIARP
jgi:hypothetical protein